VLEGSIEFAPWDLCFVSGKRACLYWPHGRDAPDLLVLSRGSQEIEPGLRAPDTKIFLTGTVKMHALRNPRALSLDGVTHLFVRR